MAALARRSWFARATATVQTWWRTTIGRIRSLRSPPGRPGIASGRVATASRAEDHLEALATSPTVYAATNRIAFGLVVYPIRVYAGYSIGGRKPELLDPERVPWVASFLRLLQTPDPEDIEGLFPVEPGEHLLAQLVADLKLAGNGYCAVTVGANGTIIGLHRLHPASCTIERRQGEWFVVYRVIGEPPKVYPRHTVAHIRLLSWQRDGRSHLGTGAGAALEHLVAAEAEALRQTAAVIGQGGADVMLTAKDKAGASYLSVPENRKKLLLDMTSALAGGPEGGRRVFIVPGDFELKDGGLKPADLKAPETLAAARQTELMAIGVVPVAVGAESGTYATAVQQYRVQAEQDEQLVAILEAFFLRPLARHFARNSTGRWRTRFDQVTARFDLSAHPGYAYVRKDAIERMKILVELGWTAEQAAEAEGLDLPKPEGTPKPAPGATPKGDTKKPRRPLGDGGGEPSEPDDVEEQSLDAWFARASDTRTDTDRAVFWARLELRRQRSDAALFRSSRSVLDEERSTYVTRAVAELDRASRAVTSLAVRVDEDPDTGATRYSDVDLAAILGDLDESVRRYLNGLSPDWLDTWGEASTHALDGTEASTTRYPVAGPDTLDPLVWSARKAVEYDRARVEGIVRNGVDAGLSVADIRARLQADFAWSDGRAMRVARTETIRAESTGTNARYALAAADGVDLGQEWISARDEDVRATHLALDGVEIDAGGTWTIPATEDHVELRTEGPGLSGEPSEDVNCRCGVRPKVRGLRSPR